MKKTREQILQPPPLTESQARQLGVTKALIKAQHAVTHIREHLMTGVYPGQRNNAKEAYVLALLSLESSLNYLRGEQDKALIEAAERERAASSAVFTEYALAVPSEPKKKRKGKR